MPDALQPKRLRIAVLNRVFSPTGGGAERYSIALVEQLAAHHEIHVFSQQVDHQWPGVTYHHVSAPLTRPRWVNQLWYATATWWATRRGFDVVHSHENTWHGQVQTVHVLPIRYNLFQGRTGLHWWLRWLKVVTSPRLLVYVGLEHRRYARQPGRFIVVTSRSLEAVMQANYPHTAPMLRVVTPGVAAVPGKPSEHDKRAARQKLGLPDTGQCIVFVGNDYRKKGLAVLLDALRQLPENVFLAVVGNSAHVPEFQPQVNANALGSRVFFLGALKDVTPAYLAADCLAHPTLEDTFAMVVLEAMAHGLPVIVSREAYCGIAGLLSHDVNALVLQDPRDASELARHLRSALQDDVLCQRLGNEALVFAHSHQWSHIANEQAQIYAWAVSATSEAARPS
jgi:glycosyltransferase involved in cell wall biosynthesis